LLPVVALRPVPGDHVYVVAPPATKGTEPPVHIVEDEVSVTVGVVLTVIVTVAVLEHAPVVPVTVYVVVAPGVAVTFEPVVALKPPAGDHVYVVAPPATNGVELPEHIELDGVTVTVGVGFTVIVTVAVLLQAPVVPVTVYVVVDAALLITLVPVVWFKPVAGDQV